MEGTETPKKIRNGSQSRRITLNPALIKALGLPDGRPVSWKIIIHEGKIGLLLQKIEDDEIVAMGPGLHLVDGLTLEQIPEGEA